MTVTIIILLALGALGTVFFAGMGTALSVCDRLILKLDIKNRSIRQGVAFRPGDNIGLSLTLMHTGELVSECLYGIGLMYAVSMWIPLSDGLKISILIGLVVISVVMFRTLPAALFARNANVALRSMSLIASTMSNFIYPWLFLVLFPVVARANRRGEDKFHDLSPFADVDSIKTNISYRSNDFKILKKALDFTNIRIRECLVPRNEIVYADIHDSIATLTRRFTGSNFSKILICDKSIDKVSGYVNAISLFRNPKSIDKILTNVIEVPETMTADQLFKLFIKRRLSVAIVIDEYGGTAGMLTVEDIIEEITGEIEDEHDSQELTEKQTSPTEYVFAGRLEIDYINEKYKIGLPKSDEYETLAGYILRLNEDFPNNGDEITDGRFSMRILQVKRPKIKLVRLRVDDTYTHTSIVKEDK